MPYTNATFFVDFEVGLDAARAPILTVAFTNSGGLVLGTKVAHGLVTGAVVDITATTSYNSAWKITRIDANTFTLDASTYVADESGTVTPRGGSSFTDAWQSYTTGASAARIQPGDHVKAAKSPAPSSIGQATWIGTTLTGGSFGEPTKSVTSVSGVTTGGPTVTVTVTAHGYSNGDFIEFSSASASPIDGIWEIENVTANTFDLVGFTVFNGTVSDTGGHLVRRVNPKVVRLKTHTAVPMTDSSGSVVCTITAHGYNTNDIVRVTGTAGGTYDGRFNITVTSANTFTLDGATYSADRTGSVVAAPVYTIFKGDGSGTVWTAANSATTATQSSLAKDGSRHNRTTPPGSGVSTKYSFTITGELAALNLSKYQRITMYAKVGVATAATDWVLCLCSDTSGAVVVDSFPIPAIPVSNAWTPITITRSGGGSLGSSIQSIALYSGISAPAATKTIEISGIHACTTSGLNMQSLISLNSLERGGAEGWYALQSLRNNLFVLDNDPQAIATANGHRGWSGTTQTSQTYKRETTKTVMGTTPGTIQDSGSLAGGNITFSGGWNTATGLQDGETILDGLGGLVNGIVVANKSFITVDSMSVSRFSNGFQTSTTCSFCTFSNLSSNNNFGNGFNVNSLTFQTSIHMLNANNNNGAGIAANVCQALTISAGSLSNNVLRGVHLNGASNVLVTSVSKLNNNGTASLSFGAATSSGNRVLSVAECNYSPIGINFLGGSNNHVMSISTLGNTTSVSTGTSQCDNFIYNANLLESPESVTVTTDYTNARIFSNKHDRTANNHWIFTDGGTVNTDAVERHTASGVSWKTSITSTIRTSSYPLDFKIAEVAVNANALVTFTCWVKKSHATDIAGAIVLQGSQIAGVPSDVVTTKANDTAWEQLTLTFTPTEAGVVEILGRAYTTGLSITDTVWFDDVDVDQA